MAPKKTIGPSADQQTQYPCFSADTMPEFPKLAASTATTIAILRTGVSLVGADGIIDARRLCADASVLSVTWRTFRGEALEGIEARRS